MISQKSSACESENEGILFSLVLTVANAFSCCTRSVKEAQATYNTDVKPSQTLAEPQEKGMFATSFEQIPCNKPIYDFEYKVGRRYVGGDNFARSPDLDIYLDRRKSLCPQDSTGSLILATEDNLDFHILADQFVELFAEVSDAQVEQLRTQFPNEVDYFLEHGERLTSLVVKQEFTRDGSENLEALQDVVEILRGMNMGEFLGALSVCSSQTCTPAALTLDVVPLESNWLNEFSEGSDSGETSDTSPLSLTPLKVPFDAEPSLKGFRPISETNIEVKHHSVVDAFEEWAALQTPCVSPW